MKSMFSIRSVVAVPVDFGPRIFSLIKAPPCANVIVYPAFQCYGTEVGHFGNYNWIKRRPTTTKTLTFNNIIELNCIQTLE